jgi:hypothetical protein
MRGKEAFATAKDGPLGTFDIAGDQDRATGKSGIKVKPVEGNPWEVGSREHGTKTNRTVMGIPDEGGNEKSPVGLDKCRRGVQGVAIGVEPRHEHGR